jgi:hypothetical protein
VQTGWCYPFLIKKSGVCIECLRGDLQGKLLASPYQSYSTSPYQSYQSLPVLQYQSLPVLPVLTSLPSPSQPLPALQSWPVLTSPNSREMSCLACLGSHIDIEILYCRYSTWLFSDRPVDGWSGELRGVILAGPDPPPCLPQPSRRRTTGLD